MTNKHKIIFWAAAIIIIVVAIGSAYYVIRRPGNPAASTPQPAAVSGPILIHYTTSLDKMAYGDFTFGYESSLALAKDYLVKGAGGTQHHALVVVDSKLAATMRLSQIPANTPNQIFVNVSPCSSYAQCRDVQGVPLGTNSTDAAFVKLFNQFADGFSVASSTAPTSPAQ